MERGSRGSSKEAYQTNRQFVFYFSERLVGEVDLMVLLQ